MLDAVCWRFEDAPVVVALEGVEVLERRHAQHLHLSCLGVRNIAHHAWLREDVLDDGPGVDLPGHAQIDSDMLAAREERQSAQTVPHALGCTRCKISSTNERMHSVHEQALHA